MLNMLKFIPTLTRLINNDLYRICSKLKIENHTNKSFEVKEKENNNRLHVSLDEFPIIYEAIQTNVNALFNSTYKIFQC